MHEVLSGIRVPEDVPQAVHGYRLQGVINREEEMRLVERIEACLALPEVRRWYDGTGRVLNEVDILSTDNASRRPDRVMIYGDEVVVLDYKFGEKPQKRYQRQVRDYMGLIARMGYKQVSGYLWYVTLGRIERVNVL